MSLLTDCSRLSGAFSDNVRHDDRRDNVFIVSCAAGERQSLARHRLDQRHRARHRPRARRRWLRRRAERLRQAGGDRELHAKASPRITAFASTIPAPTCLTPHSIAEMIETTLREFGRLDVLVNNAGIQHVAPLQDFPPAKWDAILAINLSSAFHTTRLALPSMIANRWGRIINIASAHGARRLGLQISLCGGEARHPRAHQGDRARSRRAGITCNAICPGYVYTPLVEAQIEGQAKSHGIPREQVIRDVLLAQQPNKRFATVDELGAFSVFLASDAAASITGTSIAVDGGWTAH